MLFQMIFLYLPHFAIYWYGGFAVNTGRRFTRIYTDHMLFLF
jgi:hypothetical protein